MSTAECNLILLGPPGAGKGTQAQWMVRDFQVPYIATGDILRAAVNTKTELGQTAARYMDAGELVPDAVITGIAGQRIAQPDASRGFILDGFPRTQPQAEALNAELQRQGRTLSAVVLIDVSDAEVERRLTGRRINPKSGRTYHVDFNPPKTAGICDEDGTALIQREDDQPETVQRRLAIYHEQTEPLIACYRDVGLLLTIDGMLAPAEVQAKLRTTLANGELESVSS